MSGRTSGIAHGILPVDGAPPAADAVPAETFSKEHGQGALAWAMRYGLAVVTVALASALTWLIWARIKPQVSPIFFVALLICAWYGGLGPALLATALSAFISIYAFADPVFSLRVQADDFVRVSAFTVVSIAVSALADGRRRAEAALREAHAALELRVAERTRELARLNEALRHEVGEKQAAQNKLIEHQASLQDLAAEVVLAEQRERRRLAERLHDELGQLLALSQIRVGGLHEIGDRAALDREVEGIEVLVEEAVSRARSITCELSPPVLYELGLPAALEWLAEQLRRQGGAEVSVHVDGQPPKLSEDLNVTLFHTTRELLANVRKHARATRVRVLLRSDRGAVSVVVEDDGVGFDPAQVWPNVGDATSFGLFSIRERLKPHGGTLHVLTEPGEGAQVTATLPLPDGKWGGE
jgi:signal transduction histidine kinase